MNIYSVFEDDAYINNNLENIKIIWHADLFDEYNSNLKHLTLETIKKLINRYPDNIVKIAEMYWLEEENVYIDRLKFMFETIDIQVLLYTFNIEDIPYNNSYELNKLLLDKLDEQNIDINKYINCIINALIPADDKILELYYSYGLDLNIADSDEALSKLYMHSDNYNIIRLVEKYGFDKQTMFNKIYSGWYHNEDEEEIFEYLIKKGVDFTDILTYVDCSEDSVVCNFKFNYKRIVKRWTPDLYEKLYRINQTEIETMIKLHNDKNSIIFILPLELLYEIFRFLYYFINSTYVEF